MLKKSILELIEDEPTSEILRERYVCNNYHKNKIDFSKSKITCAKKKSSKFFKSFKLSKLFKSKNLNIMIIIILSIVSIMLFVDNNYITNLYNVEYNFIDLFKNKFDNIKQYFKIKNA